MALQGGAACWAEHCQLAIANPSNTREAAVAVSRNSAMDPLRPNTSAMRLRTRPLAAGRWVVLASKADQVVGRCYQRQPRPPRGDIHPDKAYKPAPLGPSLLPER